MKRLPQLSVRRALLPGTHGHGVRPGGGRAEAFVRGMRRSQQRRQS